VPTAGISGTPANDTVLYLRRFHLHPLPEKLQITIQGHFKILACEQVIGPFV
jgi:hypothetical protein